MQSFLFLLLFGRLDWWLRSELMGFFWTLPPPAPPASSVRFMYIFSFLCSDPQPPLSVHVTQNSLCPYFRTACVSDASVILPGKRKLISSLQQDSSSCHQSVSPSVHFSFFHHIHTVFPSHSPPSPPPPLYSLSSLCPAVSATRDLFFSSRFFFFTSSPRYSHFVLASAT